MSKQSLPTPEAPFAGKKLRWCADRGAGGSPALKMFRQLGGRVVQKGPADILLIDYHCDAATLDNPPKWMTYDARTKLAAALADNRGNKQPFAVLSVSELHDQLDAALADRSIARNEARRRAQAALDSHYDEAAARTKRPGFVGF